MPRARPPSPRSTPAGTRGARCTSTSRCTSDGNEIHTGQLFFDDSFTDTVYAANEPYASRSERTTRNDDDNIYGGGGDLSTLTVQQTGSGYTGTLTMGVDG